MLILSKITPKSLLLIWGKRNNMLNIANIDSFYGSIQALKNVSCQVNEGEIVSLIGANGAGKSTLLMTICGVVHARNGSIKLYDKDITTQKPNEIVKQGLAISPEGRRIFSKLTVYENLQLGALFADPKNFNAKLDEIYHLFPRLKERQSQRGGTLSGGEQQMLAIARALMSEPKILLLDEPSLGLAPIIVRQIFQAIKEINERKKMTVLLVEQNAHHALKLAHRGYVLVNGEITLTGTGEELLSNPAIKAAYLEGGH